MCRNNKRFGKAGCLAAIAMAAGLLTFTDAAEAGRRGCAPVGCVNHASFQFGFKQPRVLASRSTNFLATRSTNFLADKNPRFLATRSTNVLAAPHQLAPNYNGAQAYTVDGVPLNAPTAAATTVRGDATGYAANRAPVFKVVRTGQK